jgi:eukaryotic-like serine/threonine-protein kinase
LQQLQPGSKLEDRYLIQGVIGLGGMGSVYRAQDLHFPQVNKIVAVKEMLIQAPDPLVRKTIIKNFEREANILVTLSHSAIPKIFDFFTVGERSYLVIEYIQGKDLEALLGAITGFIPEEQVINWAIELCDVLQYLHTHKPEPIIFRDMKPSNIMINQDGHVVLIDFGIAKIFKENLRGTMIGTEGYSPPEQYRGEASPLADIYSLGATLHHVITRHDPRLEPPFTFSERPIRRINTAVSEKFESVLQKALSYNPEDRYQSADEMKKALLSTNWKDVAGRKGFAGMTDRQADTHQPVWSFQCEDELRGSPLIENGTVYIGCYDNNLYALNSSDGKFLWKFTTEGGITTKPVIHVGQLYFGSDDGTIYGISTRSGKLTWSFQVEGPIRSSPRIAEDHLFFGCDGGYFYSINLILKRTNWRFETGSFIRTSPAFFKDLMIIGCESGEVIGVDMRGDSRWRFRAKRSILASPLVIDDLVIISSLDSTLYALDAGSGWTVWRFRMDKGSASSPIAAEQFIYAGSAGGHLYCLDANGKELWRYQSDGQVSGSPAIFFDSIYFGDSEGMLHCLEFRTGRLRWKYKTSGLITGMPCMEDGVIYIGSGDHKLYAFNL